MLISENNQPKIVAQDCPLIQEVARIRELMELKEQTENILAAQQEELAQEVVLYGLSGQLPTEAIVPHQELSFCQRKQLREDKVWFLPTPKSPRGVWKMGQKSRAVITSSGRIGQMQAFLMSKLAKLAVLGVAALTFSDVMITWAFKPLAMLQPMELVRDWNQGPATLLIIAMLFLYTYVVFGGICLLGKGLWEFMNWATGKHGEIEWLEQAKDKAHKNIMDSLKSAKEWCRLEEQSQRFLVESQGQKETV